MYEEIKPRVYDHLSPSAGKSKVYNNANFKIDKRAAVSFVHSKNLWDVKINLSEVTHQLVMI